MSAPLTIRFATDHAGAKSGIQDLAASVVSNMVKVSDSLNIGAQANGGYLATVKTLANNVVGDFAKVGSAGLKAANDSNYSVVATAAAITKTAAATETAGVVAKGAFAVTGEAAKFHLGVVRNEMAATARVIASSPLLVGVAAAATTFVALKLAIDFVTAAAHAASQALEGTAKIGDDAAKFGVSTTFLQTYSAQARSLRVDVDDLTKSLEMAKGAFTVKQGEGGADARNESAFAARLRTQAGAGNVTQAQVDRFSAASGTEAQFRVALDLISELQAKGRDLAALDLAGKLFPPEIVERIRAGTIEIDRLRKTMDDVRNPDLVLLKPEDIARAQELQRRLEAAQATLDKAGKEFNVEMAKAGANLKEDAIGWTELMASGARLAVGILKEARQYMERQDATRPAIFGVDYFNAKDAPKSGLAKDVGAPSLGPATGDAERDNALNRLRGNLGNRTLIEQAQAASRAMTDGVSGARKDQTKPIVAAVEKKAASSADSLDAVETFINGLEKSAAAVKAEADAFGKSNAEKATAINLAKLKETADQKGIAVTDEQTAKVKAASEATARYRDRLQDLEQAQRQAAEASRFLWGGISDNIADAVLNGKSFANVIGDLSKMTFRSGLQALFTGQGALAGLLGTAPKASAGDSAVGGIAGMMSSLFGGFRANGGPVKAGRAYTVGELGQEQFVPDQDGRIIPAGRQQSPGVPALDDFGSSLFGGFRAGGGRVSAGKGYTVGELGQELFVPDQDGRIIPAGRGGSAGTAPVLNFIDQRPAGSADLAPSTRPNASGGTDILLREAESGLYNRGRKGRGALGPTLNTAATRTG